MEKEKNYIIHVCILSGNALEFLSVLKLQEKSVALSFIFFCICNSQWPFMLITEQLE